MVTITKCMDTESREIILKCMDKPPTVIILKCRDTLSREIILKCMDKPPRAIILHDIVWNSAQIDHSEIYN